MANFKIIAETITDAELFGKMIDDHMNGVFSSASDFQEDGDEIFLILHVSDHEFEVDEVIDQTRKFADSIGINVEILEL